MKIKRVRIENFRCLNKVDIAFDEITCFVGPTGAGKSTVLRGLDWFFNGEKETGLSIEDVHSAVEEGGRITVEVEFDGLTESDRTALGRYAPEGAETVSVWRTWEDGDDKITGKAFAYGPFERVRLHTNATELRNAYRELRESDPSLELSPASSKAAAEAAMTAWESVHRDRLTETEVEATHFFGFAGQSKLAELIDFVFVSADLRAYEEADDSKATALGRILEHSVDRTAVNKRLADIDESAHQARQEAQATEYSEPLGRLSAALSQGLAEFTTGRDIVVTPTVQPQRAARTGFQITVRDGAAQTSVHRQGHGFQRALIIAALKYLALQRRPEGGTRTLCLAIEEPELYQHPPQARTFAEVLRALVEESPAGLTQVMYATHNPVFIEPRSYHEIRRLSCDGAEAHPVTRVWQVSEPELIQVLPAELVSEGAVRRKVGILCAENLAEGFFARAVVLVEGVTDRAVILGCSERQRRNWGAKGISVINAGGKANIALCHAILNAMGVPCYAVFDGDAGKRERSLRKIQPGVVGEERTKKERAIDEEYKRDAGENANLLGYLGAPSRAPWPTTESTAGHAVFEDHMETFLAESWPAWGSRVAELIDSGEGFPAKNAATYREAARTAVREPPFILQALLENAAALVK
ncbi:MULTISPECIES: ATP-dependent nuclease [unclassified Streptomyces]|uniref:ATP-dependent nuclease n=1 Tax=unclassified Streptomyces TaxID=2593676 RepID=UPI001EDBF7EA|nr:MULTISPECIES: AAA family ATPase [unclassified Streptomyces]UKL06969.1 ATP-dependent endonuclease [Streptomyces sp. NBU3104]